MKAQLSAARERKLHFKNTVSPQDGGTPALNFVNTLRNRGSANPKDYLTTYEDFLYWCYHAGVVDYDHYQAISLEAYCYAREAAGVFEEVIKARFMLHEIFLSVLKGEPTDEIFVRQFNLLINMASKNLCYESTVDGWRQVWINIDEEIAVPFWIVIKCAADLLLKADAKRIKQCKTCGGLFFDKTKNSTRRWCSPSACGRVFNDKRYYSNKKGIKSGAVGIC